MKIGRFLFLLIFTSDPLPANQKEIQKGENKAYILEGT